MTDIKITQAPIPKAEHGQIWDPARQTWIDGLVYAKREALAQNETRFTELLGSLTNNASAVERDTWPIKAAAAEAVLDGSASQIQTELIKQEAAATGYSPKERAQIICDKAKAYHRHVTLCSSLKQAADQAVRAATSHAELQTTLDKLAKDRAAQLKTDAQ